MGLVTDYIISLNNLYGFVHKEKVVEIYNRQNNDQITLSDVEFIMKNDQEMLRGKFAYVDGVLRPPDNSYYE